MGYNLPNFNLVCAIYDQVGGLNQTLPRVITTCNLTFKWPFVQYNGSSAAMSGVYSVILLPKGTDIRDLRYTTPDLVSVPMGSGAWYYAEMVQDRGKGFANEHRVAGLKHFSALFPLP